MRMRAQLFECIMRVRLSLWYALRCLGASCLCRRRCVSEACAIVMACRADVCTFVVARRAHACHCHGAFVRMRAPSYVVPIGEPLSWHILRMHAPLLRCINCVRLVAARGADVRSCHDASCACVRRCRGATCAGVQSAPVSSYAGMCPRNKWPCVHALQLM